MEKPVELTKAFETHRSHLRAVAYRMLGSFTEADDAVQKAWLKLDRTDADDIRNIQGWLTTVVARVCLDILRSRKSLREEPLDTQIAEPITNHDGANPEQEALLADSVGIALLVVLDTLAPAERVAFVLHDVFDLSFDEIARVLGRTPVAARQLASRARKRVRGGEKIPAGDLKSQRAVVEAFLAALRVGDFQGLVAVLDPDVLVRADTPGAPGAPREIRGAENWARGAIAYSRLARFVQPAIINGTVGLVFASRGRLSRAVDFKIAKGKIVQVDIIAAPERLQQLDLAIL
jgi:RNA polymerase sigma-70 factor, ECF subfamily